MKRLPLARFRVFAVFVGLTILVGMAASASTAGSQAASGMLNLNSGMLNLNTALRLRSVIGECRPACRRARAQTARVQACSRGWDR